MEHAPQHMRTHSLTAVTADRRRLFQVESTALLLLNTIQDYRSKGNFELYAFVVMPDHVHLLLTPAPEVPVEKVMQLIKGGFSFRLKSKMEVWERGYFDRRLKSTEDFVTCMRYIEENPVRGRLVSSTEEYPYSSLVRPEMIDAAPEWFRTPGQG